MSVSAAMVKELRAMTGAGILDAKKALVETGGEMDAAVDWLRTKGMAKAAKKSGRATGEGQICVSVAGQTGVAVEVNSETDFVARNSEFCGFVRKVANAALSVDSLGELMEAPLEGGTVQGHLSAMVAALGENMVIRRFQKIQGSTIASYVHNRAEEGVGKIGVLVAFDGEDNGIGRQIAMHVAATNPISLSEDDAPAERVERERMVLVEIAKSSGKPPAIIEKIVDGGMRKFFATETLLNQKFVINPDMTVAQAAKDAGIAVTGFVFMKVGEDQN